MTKTTKSVLVALAVVVLSALVAFSFISKDKEEVEPPVVIDTLAVENYVRENISTLSPEPAVLGGTFYVTAIDVGDGMGTVEYEDGHIALTADFTFTQTATGEVIIESFEVRDNL